MQYSNDPFPIVNLLFLFVKEKKTVIRSEIRQVTKVCLRKIIRKQLDGLSNENNEQSLWNKLPRGNCSLREFELIDIYDIHEA